FERCNELLRQPDFTTLGLLRQFDVAVVATTDDPADTLEHHHALARRPDPDTRVVPTWRPDAALAVEDVMDALDRRHAEFHEAGCRASDHGLEQMYASPADPAAMFARLRAHKSI